MPTHQITPALPVDSESWITLRGQTRENAVSQARLASLGITAQSWGDDVKAGLLLGFCAHDAEQTLLGYCFGDSKTGEVVVLALLPQAEGSGIGRELLSRVVAALRTKGHRRLFLGCSSNPAHRSHGFYRHLGWRSTGEVDALGDEVLELV